MTKNNFDTLAKLIEATQLQIQQEGLPTIREEIDSIILKKDTSEQRIESLLDRIIDFVQFGYGAEEFLKLHSYYATVNQDYAAFYKELYDDIFRE